MSLIRDDNNVAWQEAMHLYHMGRYEQAKEKFMPFLATSQEDGQLLFFVAYCSFKLDQLDEAETFAREALRVGYFGEEVYSLLGIICKAKGAYAEAEEFFGKPCQKSAGRRFTRPIRVFDAGHSITRKRRSC